MSARQIIVIAFASAMIAAGTVACLGNLGNTFTSAAPPEAVPEATQPVGISNPDSVSDERNNIEVYKSMSPGVAFINTSSVSYVQDWFGDVQAQEGKGSGSGSVIDAQGHILTNYHVIENAQKLTVSFGSDKTYPATLVGGDPDTDLAVIKIDAPAGALTVVPFGDSEKLEVGQKVLAIGNPFGLDRTLTTGVISGLQRPIRAVNDRLIEGAIQTDASINPGNSGGPLLDKYGRMIGINSQILSRSGGSVGVGFAVPVSIAKRIVPQLIQFGKVNRPNLGVTGKSVADLTEQGNRLPTVEGLLVMNVKRGSVAERAGIKGLSRDGYDLVIGDIIVSVDGQKVSSQDDLYRLLDKKNVGDSINVEVYRGGKNVTIPIKLQEVPAAAPARGAPRTL